MAKEEKCLHKNRTDNPEPDNLQGDYFEWVCNDCGYKKMEGRSYAHKEICEYSSMLKKAAKKKNPEHTVQCLRLMNAMINDAIARLTSEDDDENAYYYEFVF